MSKINKKRKLLDTRTLVASSLLTAISIIFTRVFAVMVPLAGVPALRLSFGQIPIAITGILFGPFAGGIAGAVADLVGFMLNPGGGVFFPGFTLSSMLWGIIPGLFYKIMNNRRTGINFNIVNTIVIILLTVGLVNLVFSGGIISIENGNITLSGSTLEIVISIIAIVVAIVFIIIPFVISRRYKEKEDRARKSIYSIDKIVFIITISYVIISLGLNTLWLTILYDSAFMAFLPGRILAGVFMIPIFSMAIYVLSKFFKYVRN
ncbi:folate family ECF transporter S component [Sporosalibacterium faouarense]|uniref:folate family ECF transporter S component n=1 Tax=Sporosalibacterium faouarense TaxID=516123 RepID=UPI00192B0620|nr:folate family ECF transporter S component [Sporosalibacterium faouarense]